MIVDTPPVSVVTDAAVLCRVADGVLLVVRPGVTTIQGAQLSKKNLEAVNAHILGVIMNATTPKRPAAATATPTPIRTATTTPNRKPMNEKLSCRAALPYPAGH